MSPNIKNKFAQAARTAAFSSVTLAALRNGFVPKDYEMMGICIASAWMGIACDKGISGIVDYFRYRKEMQQEAGLLLYRQSTTAQERAQDVRIELERLGAIKPSERNI